MEIVIKPSSTQRLDWRELWAYRELFYFFAWRDVKVRYKQTVVGMAWAVFQPFILMVVFTAFFNHVLHVSSGKLPYAIFSYSGLLFWNYFSQTLSRASESLTSNAMVLTKVYFPRVVAPISAAVVAFIDFMFAALIFAGLMVYYGIAPGWKGLLLFVPMLLMSFLTAGGAGMFLAALNAKYRDVRQILPFFIQVLLFLTPVIYPVGYLPHNLRWLLYLNPMTGVISTVRSTLIGGGSVNPALVALSAAIAVLLFVGGLTYFLRRERLIADVL